MPAEMSCPGCHASLVLGDGRLERHQTCPVCGSEIAAHGSTSPTPADPDPDLVEVEAPGSDHAAAPHPEFPDSDPDIIMLEAPAAARAARLPEEMTANRVVAGRRCPSCSGTIGLGQAIRNCAGCNSSYHVGCWTGLCTSQPCAAPIDSPAVAPSRPASIADGVRCPACAETVPRDEARCPFCQEWLQVFTVRYEAGTDRPFSGRVAQICRGEGTLRVSREVIEVEGKDQTSVATGFAVFGIIGAVIAQSMASKRTVRVPTAEVTQVVYEPDRFRTRFCHRAPGSWGARWYQFRADGMGVAANALRAAVGEERFLVRPAWQNVRRFQDMAITWGLLSILAIPFIGVVFPIVSLVYGIKAVRLSRSACSTIGLVLGLLFLAGHAFINWQIISTM